MVFDWSCALRRLVQDSELERYSYYIARTNLLPCIVISQESNGFVDDKELDFTRDILYIIGLAKKLPCHRGTLKVGRYCDIDRFVSAKVKVCNLMTIFLNFCIPHASFHGSITSAVAYEVRVPPWRRRVL